MPREVLNDLAADLHRLLGTGAGAAADDASLRQRGRQLQRPTRQVPALAPVIRAVSAVARGGDAAALLDLLVTVRQARSALAPAGLPGVLEPVAASGAWQTETTPDLLCSLREALAEPSRSRRWNRLHDAIADLRKTNTADLRILDPLLSYVATGEQDNARRIVEKDLPAYGRALLSEMLRSLDLHGTAADALRLAVVCAIDRDEGLSPCRTALTEGSDAVRAAALRLLARHSRAEAEQTALDLLARPKVALVVQKEAVQALASSRRDAARDALLTALHRPRIATEAYFALRKVSNRGLTSLLLDELRRTLATVEAAAPSPKTNRSLSLLHHYLMSALAYRPEEEALKAVVALMEHPCEQLRRDAASVVWDQCNNHKAAGRALSELAAALSSPHLESRDAAVNVLGSYGPAARPAVAALIAALSGEADFGLRRRIIEALGAIGGPAEQIVPAALRAMRDPVSYVRSQAVWTLAEMGTGSRAAVPELLRALRGHDPSFAAAAPAALMRIALDDPEVLAAIISALNHPESQVRGQCVNAPIDSERLRAVPLPALIERLSDPEAWVRGRAVDALGLLGPDAAAAVPPLTDLLGRPDPNGWYSVKRIAEALGKIGPAGRPAVPALVEAKRGANKELRDAIDAAIAAIAGE